MRKPPAIRHSKKRSKATGNLNQSILIVVHGSRVWPKKTLIE